MQPPVDITAKSWGMVAVLGLIWGSTFLVIEVALEGITPFWLAAGRITFAALLTSAIWGLRGWRFHLGPDRDWSGLFAVGLLSTAIPFQLLSWGQQYVTSAFAGVSMASVALIVLPLSHFLIPGERITPRRLLGLSLVFSELWSCWGNRALSRPAQPLSGWPDRSPASRELLCNQFGDHAPFARH